MHNEFACSTVSKWKIKKTIKGNVVTEKTHNKAPYDEIKVAGFLTFRLKVKRET
jgi:hypothetical protein